MLGQKHEIARLQSDFYRNQFRKILRWLMMSIFVMYALIAAIFYFILVAPPQSYYGNTTDGKILRMPGAKNG
jgi:hypothetical protein